MFSVLLTIISSLIAYLESSIASVHMCYDKLVVSHVILRITCSGKETIKALEVEAYRRVFFRTHNMVPGSL